MSKKNNHYAYQYKLEKGGGTWITGVPPDKAKEQLSKRFPKDKVMFVMLNNG